MEDKLLTLLNGNPFVEITERLSNLIHNNYTIFKNGKLFTVRIHHRSYLFYDKNGYRGLSYPIADKNKYLKKVKSENYSPSYTSIYADIVTKTLATNEGFCKYQCKPVSHIYHRSSRYPEINLTMVANLAYMALHSVEKYRERYKKMYSDVIKKIKYT
jgi:hypothetical protein